MCRNNGAVPCGDVPRCGFPGDVRLWKSDGRHQWGLSLAIEQKNQVKESPQSHSLPYFLASLAGIARALEDFGYRDEAEQLFG